MTPSLWDRVQDGAKPTALASLPLRLPRGGRSILKEECAYIAAEIFNDLVEDKEILFFREVR